jgi:hypothetical protein
MALYLVEHLPREQADDAVSTPTDLIGLARYSVAAKHGARWLSAFSPDLHDDRYFSIWEAANASEIQTVMEKFGFLSESEIKAFVVRQWGPDDVIAEHDTA